MSGGSSANFLLYIMYIIGTKTRELHQMQKLPSLDQVSQGTFLRSKQTVTVAIELNWLTDHGIDLGELEQEHLDA